MCVCVCVRVCVRVCFSFPPLLNSTLHSGMAQILNILHLFKADFKPYILDIPDTESIRIKGI